MIIFQSDEYRDGWIRVPEEYREVTSAWTATRRGPFQVKLTEIRKPRSTGRGSQCNHFHGHCRQIAVETGNDMEMVEFVVKRRAVSQGYPLKTDAEGGYVISLLDGLPEPQSEAEASIADDIILIEVAHQLAAEEGIKLIEEDYGVDEKEGRAE